MKGRGGHKTRIIQGTKIRAR